MAHQSWDAPYGKNNNTQRWESILPCLPWPESRCSFDTMRASELVRTMCTPMEWRKEGMPNGEDPYCQNPITEKRRVTTKKEKAYFLTCLQIVENYSPITRTTQIEPATDCAGQGGISEEFKKKQKTTWRKRTEESENPYPLTYKAVTHSPITHFWCFVQRLQ